uniref:Uncharacterized protein n=1 Tax=Zea mays TaxID=4577 RepID=A0A804LDH0_MAIZE
MAESPSSQSQLKLFNFMTMTKAKEPLQSRVEPWKARPLSAIFSDYFSIPSDGFTTLYDCEEMLSKYREEGISVPVPAEEQNLVNRHHKAFLDSMSDDLKTTEVLDGEDGFTDLLKAINSNLNDLKKLQQKLKQQQQTQKQPEDYVQGLIALETEIKDKLSLLGLEVLKPPWPRCAVDQGNSRTNPLLASLDPKSPKGRS